MILLDLPPELFEYIIAYLVTTAGVRQAWGLREVCRAFRERIDVEIFANQPIEAFLEPGDLNARKILRENQALYLSYHIWNEKDACTFLPRYMGGICKEACEGLVIKQHDRWEHTRTLCDRLFEQLSKRDACLLLELHDPTKTLQETVDEARERFLRHDSDIMMAAAAVFGNLKALRAAFHRREAELRTDFAWGVLISISKFIGSPLDLAAAGGHYGVVSAILKHFETTNEETLEFNCFDAAIKASLENNHVDIALLILRISHAYGPPIKDEEAALWAKLAFRTKNREVVHEVQKVRREHAAATFEAACASGDLTTIRMFIEEEWVMMNCVTSCLGDEERGKTPIQLAADCRGATEAVRLLLDMGADPDPHTELDPYRALEFAVDNNDYDMVKVLLEYGANAEEELEEIKSQLRLERLSWYSKREAIIKLLLKAKDRGDYSERVKGPRTNLTNHAEDLIEKE